MFIVFRSKFGEKKRKRAQRETDFPVTRKPDSSLVSATPPPLPCLESVVEQSTICRCCFAGKYVMVMGVIQAASPEPLVRAVKMADLSELAALHRRMWKLEVEDLQQVLA